MKPFTTFTIVLLVVFAFLHGLRLMLDWRVTIDGLAVPMWVSVAAVFASLMLAVLLAWENRK